jgi:hypothetical protein
MKPVVCVGCRLFFKVKKNGIAVEEGMPRGDGTWTAYKLWQGDLWECAGCGAQIIRGFGQAPIAEHFEPKYAAAVDSFNPLFRVDDC